jgi:hypothetical protein
MKVKLAKDIEVGEYIIVWRGRRQEAVRIVAHDDTDGAIRYEIMTGDDSGSVMNSRYIPTQETLAIKTAKAAIRRAKLANEELEQMVRDREKK